jgi:hypothetical protein
VFEDSCCTYSSRLACLLCCFWYLLYSSPGGGRVWPLSAYWSYSEYQQPTKCLVPEACLGVDVATATTAPSGAAAALTDTQKCSVAYTGPRCSLCSTGYYQLSSRCYFCGSSVDQTRDISLVVIVGLCAMVFLSLLIAMLKAVALAEVMQVCKAAALSGD